MDVLTHSPSLNRTIGIISGDTAIGFVLPSSHKRQTTSLSIPVVLSPQRDHFRFGKLGPSVSGTKPLSAAAHGLDFRRGWHGLEGSRDTPANAIVVLASSLASFTSCGEGVGIGIVGPGAIFGG